MNKIYGILAIFILLSVAIQTTLAAENKEYTCVDKNAVKSPPPALDILSGDTNIEKKIEPLCPEGKVPKSKDNDKDIGLDAKIDNSKMLGQLYKDVKTDAKIDIKIDDGKNIDPLDISPLAAYCTLGYCYHWAGRSQFVNNYGASAYLTEHNPEVKDYGIHSKAMVSVADNKYNQVAIGWRKGQYDSSSKLFVLWWKKGIPQGYYWGWRQYSNIYYPGMTLVGSNGGARPYTIMYYNGDWWMAYNGVWIGYYDGGLFAIDAPFNIGTKTLYLGEVMTDDFGLCMYCLYTDMGNGLWASNPNAAKIYNQKYMVVSQTYSIWLNAQTNYQMLTSPNLYTISTTGSNSFRYGGPGLGGTTVTPSITLDYPNGGENLIRGTLTTISAYGITWRYNGQPGPNVRIDLYKGGVLNKILTSSTPIYANYGGQGYYVWSIPYTQALGSDYKIKITSTSNSAYSDWSNNYFTISDANYIRVTLPNGGESWQRGTTKTITWTKGGNVGSYVKIDLYKAGVFKQTIISSTPNDGSHNWYVPWALPIGSDYKIKITSTSNSAYYDLSNNYFKIY